MKRRGRRAAVLLVTGVIALSSAVAGYAYWTSTGTDSGAAAVGTTSPWQVDVSTATGLPLYPGGNVQAVQYTVTNSGGVDQRLNSVTVSVANPDSSPWAAGSCSAADFSVNGAAAGSPYVAAGLADLYGPGGSQTGTVYVSMVDTGANQNDCKGVTVPLYFAAS
jgi:hypothetical protein